jgi:hypothetical protein
MSVITFGTSFVGKIDRVEGKYYVVTRSGARLVMIATWWKTRRGLRASPERARELDAIFDAKGGGPPREKVG